MTCVLTPAAPLRHPCLHGHGAAGLRLRTNCRANQHAHAHGYHGPSADSGPGDGYACTGDANGHVCGHRHGCPSNTPANRASPADPRPQRQLRRRPRPRRNQGL